jgi:hypothetical protein
MFPTKCIIGRSLKGRFIRLRPVVLVAHVKAGNWKRPFLTPIVPMKERLHHGRKDGLKLGCQFILDEQSSLFVLDRRLGGSLPLLLHVLALMLILIPFGTTSDAYHTASCLLFAKILAQDLVQRPIKRCVPQGRTLR